MTDQPAPPPDAPPPDVPAIPLADQATAGDRFAANIAVMRRLQPEIAAVIDQVGAPACARTVAADGRFNLAFDGASLYPEPVARHIADQLAAYWRAPARLAVSPPTSRSIDRHSADFLVRLMRRSIEAEIPFEAEFTELTSHFAIVFGVGLGYHLAELIATTQCRVLVLIEPNPEFLLHALHATDWTALVERFSQDGCALHLLTVSDPRALATAIRSIVRMRNVCCFEGAHFYRHYANRAMDLALNEALRDIYLYIVGLGYFEDEQTMIAHSAINLGTAERPILTPENGGAIGLAADAPAFIVGSGPSLDADLSFLRQNAGRALIISCGSALRPLLQAGVTPHFQVEIENVEESFTALSATRDAFDFAGVCLVASTTIHPKVLALFDETILFFRRAVCTADLFGRPLFAGLDPTGPTVANGGLTVALALGCRDIMFFGMDMGTKHASRHHAAESLYHIDDAPLTDPAEFKTPLVGNFGGTIYSYYVLMWAKDAIETVIAGTGQTCRYVNCSDGALILGATPRKSRTLMLDPAFDSARAADRLKKNLPVYPAAEFAARWDVAALSGACRAQIGRYAAVFRDAPGFAAEIKDWAVEAFALAIGPEQQTYQNLLSRGTVLTMMMCAIFFLRRIADPEQRRRFDRIARDEMIATLDGMADEVDAFFAMVEQSLPRTRDAAEA